MSKNLRLLLAAASIAMSSLSAHALVATESFDYTAGQQLSGLNGGSGWGGAWTGSSTATIQSPSLDFPGRTETGNKAILGYNNALPLVGLNRQRLNRLNRLALVSVQPHRQ